MAPARIIALLCDQKLGAGDTAQARHADLLGPARGAADFWWPATADLAVAGVAVTAYFLRVSHVRR